MNLLQLLSAQDPEFVLSKCKIHLACWNGKEEPIDKYFQGTFNQWQCEQNNKNFERPLVISLIDLPQRHLWMFAGVFESHGCAWAQETLDYRYDLRKVDRLSEFNGRLIVHFERPGRQSYLNAERWGQRIIVNEVRQESLSLLPFPGFSQVRLPKKSLDVVIQQQVASWRSALQSVAGVYVISDQITGKLYIGSAYGIEGIWGRWCCYAKTGHGDNVELKTLLEAQGIDYSANFQFGILEIADIRQSAEEICKRETHWKELLLSRNAFGYNKN